MPAEDTNDFDIWNQGAPYLEFGDAAECDIFFDTQAIFLDASGNSSPTSPSGRRRVSFF